MSQNILAYCYVWMIRKINGYSTYKGVRHLSGIKFLRKIIKLKINLSFICLFTGAYGDVMCYECAWQGSTPLPSTNDGVSDVCRPHNFNVDVVHKIKCANGCSKQALYEFGKPNN